MAEMLRVTSRSYLNDSYDNTTQLNVNSHTVHILSATTTGHDFSPSTPDTNLNMKCFINNWFQVKSSKLQGTQSHHDQEQRS